MEIKFDKKLKKDFLELENHIKESLGDLNFEIVSNVIKNGNNDSDDDSLIPYENFMCQVCFVEKSEIKINLGFFGRSYQIIQNEVITDVVDGNFKMNKKKRFYCTNNVNLTFYDIKEHLQNKECFNAFISLLDVFSENTNTEIKYKVSYCSELDKKTKEIKDKIVFHLQSSVCYRCVNVFTNKKLLNNELYWKSIIFELFYKDIGLFEKGAFLNASIENIKGQMELLNY